MQKQTIADPTYDEGYALGLDWAKHEAHANEFEMLNRPDVVCLWLTPDTSPTLLDHLTNNMGDTLGLDLTTPFGLGLKDAAALVFALVTDPQSSEMGDSSIPLSVEEIQSIKERIGVTAIAAANTAFDRGLWVGSEWVADATPAEIDALHKIDLNSTRWQPFTHLGLDSLADWITNDLGDGYVRHFDPDDPYHQGVVNGALDALSTADD